MENTKGFLTGKEHKVSDALPILEVIPYRFSVYKVVDYSLVDLDKPFFFTGSTDLENSLVCPEEDVPCNTTDRSDGWRGFFIKGKLDFSLIGILSGISGILASSQIGLFAISTYDTDYIFTKETDHQRALLKLKEAGYEVRESR